MIFLLQKNYCCLFASSLLAAAVVVVADDLWPSLIELNFGSRIFFIKSGPIYWFVYFRKKIVKIENQS